MPTFTEREKEIVMILNSLSHHMKLKPEMSKRLVTISSIGVKILLTFMF